MNDTKQELKANLNITRRKGFYTLKSFDFELSTNNVDLLSSFVFERYGVII